MTESCLDVLLRWGIKANPAELRVDMKKVTPAESFLHCSHGREGHFDLVKESPRYQKWEDFKGKLEPEPCFLSHFRSVKKTQEDRAFARILEHQKLASVLKLIELEAEKRVQHLLREPSKIHLPRNYVKYNTVGLFSSNLDDLVQDYDIESLDDLVGDYAFRAIKKASEESPSSFFANFNLLEVDPAKITEANYLAYFTFKDANRDQMFLLKESYQHLKALDQDLRPTTLFLMPLDTLKGENKRDELKVQGQANMLQRCWSGDIRGFARTGETFMTITKAYLYPHFENQAEFDETLKVLALEQEFSQAFKSAQALASS